MPNSHHQHTSTPENEARSFSRLTLNPPQHHTHLQRVAPCIQLEAGGGGWC